MRSPTADGRGWTKVLTQTGGTLQSAIDGSSSQVTRLQTRISDMTLRLTATEKLLKTQFLAMERAISQLNTSRNLFAAQSGQRSG